MWTAWRISAKKRGGHGDSMQGGWGRGVKAKGGEGGVAGGRGLCDSPGAQQGAARGHGESPGAGGGMGK